MDRPDNDLTAAEIVAAAELDKTSVARVTVNRFCSMLGGFSGEGVGMFKVFQCA